MIRRHIFNKLVSLKYQVRRLFRRIWFGKRSDNLSWSKWLAPAIDVQDTPDKLVYKIEIPASTGRISTSAFAEID